MNPYQPHESHRLDHNTHPPPLIPIHPSYVHQQNSILPHQHSLPPQLSHLFNIALPSLPLGNQTLPHAYYPQIFHSPTPTNYSYNPPPVQFIRSQERVMSNKPEDLLEIENYIVSLLGKSKILDKEEETPLDSVAVDPVIASDPELVRSSSSSSSLYEQAKEQSMEQMEITSKLDVEVEANEKHQGASREENNHAPTPVQAKKARELIYPSNFDVLTEEALGIFQNLRPHPGEFSRRLKVLHQIQKIVTRIWPDHHASLHLFGSSANNFGIKNSDMDICLTIDDKAGTMQKIVQKLGDTLRKKNFKQVKTLSRARVPIVKFTDPISNFSCDICINNHLAIQNTKLIADYSKIDQRFVQLGYLVKHWAKKRQINETYQGTLSSYAYILMVVHFLQCRGPPILPVLQEMRDPESHTVKVMINDFDCYYFTKVESLKNFGSSNKESIGELFAAYIKFYAIDFDWENSVISPRTGQTLSKMEKRWDGLTPSDDPRDSFCFGLEDPFETSHNLGKVVDQQNLKIIRWEFNRAYKMICSGDSLKLISKPYDEKDLNGLKL